MNISKHFFVNIMLAIVWAYFAYTNLVIFFEKPQLTILLFVLAQTEFIILLLVRKPALLVTKGWREYILAIAGTFIALLFQPALYDAVSSAAQYVRYLGDVFVYLGVLLEIISFISLNTSAGIVPANRGVKSKGLYAYVRHPIYASYILLYIGYAINNPSFFNGFILTVAFILQIMRIYKEEGILNLDPSYKEYSTKVRWRLIPGLF